MKNKVVSIIGLGYIGLPLAVHLLSKNMRVHGVDVDQTKISMIRDNKLSQLVEPDMVSIVDGLDSNLLSVDTEVIKSDIFIICVPTPMREKKADLSYIMAALDNIIPVLKKGDLIIIESTIPPGTCRDVITPLIEKQSEFRLPQDIGIVHCPERVLPGDLTREFVENSRVVGGSTEEWTKLAIELYSTFVKGEIVGTDTVTAELCKLMENTYRDINIAIANMTKLVSNRLGVDVNEVIRISNKHPRVNILNPGIGVGGHCLPIDPLFLLDKFPQETSLIRESRYVNNYMTEFTKDEILSKFDDKPSSLVLFGKSYKKNVKDDRESPALEIAKHLKNEGVQIKILDPYYEETNYTDIIEEVRGFDAIIVLVPHDKIMKEINDNKENLYNALKGEKQIIIYS